MDRERIGVIGICGSGSFAISAAKIDPRLKAIATISMYDMGEYFRTGLNRTRTAETRNKDLQTEAEQRYTAFESGTPVYGPGQNDAVFPEAAESNDFYQTEKYDDIWFSPNGKPMICGITSDNRGASDQVLANPDYSDVFPDSIAERFDLRESQWPQGSIEHENALPWMSWKYPQSIHPNLKAISVSVAQHDPFQINFSAKGPTSSRGYDHTTKKICKDYGAGQNFESQWKTVFDYEAQGKTVENVLLTSWNEWMAIKTFNGNETVFCDVYNEEYSRDIEMMKSDLGDNFYLIAKVEGVIAGLFVFGRVFSLLSDRVTVEYLKKDGDRVKKGDLLAKVRGDMRAILTGERTALNYLQRMSGVATYTARLCGLLKGTGIRLVDTRKTTPNMRVFEKYAVRVGGGLSAFRTF